jgi:hypothetical protein
VTETLEREQHVLDTIDEFVDNLNARASVKQSPPLILDKSIQYTLAIRVALYWIACVVYFSVVLFFSQVMVYSELALSENIRLYLCDMLQWVPAIFLLLPLAIFDILKVSQKMLLPVNRVRAGLTILASGQTPAALPIEDEVYHQDLLDTYNSIRDSVIAESVAVALESKMLDSALAGPDNDDNELG